MSNQPAVSVIVPVYNTREYLGECVESILGQSFADFELVLVNDDSDDGSEVMCDDYARRDGRVVVVHRDNAGQSAARNTGIDISRGRYLCFVDADDVLHPRFLEILVDITEKTGAGIAIGSHCEGVAARWGEPGGKAECLGSLEVIRDTLYQKGPACSVWGKLYDRSVFDGLRFKEGRWYEDLDIFYHLYSRTPMIAVTGDVLYFYRNRPGSFLNVFTPRRLDVIAVTDEIERYCRRHIPGALKAAHDRKLSANFNMFILSSRAGLNDWKRRCWSTVKRYRLSSLKDPRVRLKNKIGVLVSYLGPGTVLLASRFLNIK